MTTVFQSEGSPLRNTVTPTPTAYGGKDLLRKYGHAEHVVKRARSYLRAIVFSTLAFYPDPTLGNEEANPTRTGIYYNFFYYQLFVGVLKGKKTTIKTNLDQ